MDKFFNNTKTSILNKFRNEVSKESEDDFINSRRLTVQPKDNAPTESSSDIDRQISDLENLIKRLQDEIAEMSSNASKDNIYDYSEETEKIPQENKHIYPISYDYVETTPLAETNSFKGKIDQLLDYEKTTDTPGTFYDIRDNYSDLFGENSRSPTKVEETENYEPSEPLEVMIQELKAELTEKLESLENSDEPTTYTFEE